MNTHFLTTKYLIKGKLVSLFEKILPNTLDLEPLVEIDGASLVRWIKKQNNENLTSVGLFNIYGDKSILKIVRYKMKNILYEQIINEFSMLDLLSNISNSDKKITIKFPTVRAIHDNKNEIIMVSEYIKGKSLSGGKDIDKVRVIKKILSNFILLTEKINKTKHSLPRRSSLYIALSFPIFLAIVILNDIRNIDRYLSFLYLFMKNYLSFNIFKTDYVLTHKDLHTKNIILKNNQPFIIDPEVCVFADSETDLAHISRYLSHEISHKYLLNLLNDLLLTQKQRRKFIALTIYYSIQMMAIRTKNDPDYIEAYNYLNKDFNKIYKSLLLKDARSIGEYLFLFGLDMISIVNKLIGVGKQKSDIILCYHSIDKDRWQYSTTKDDLENQIKYLKKTKYIVDIKDIILHTKSGSRVAITFDDGYKDFLTNALPILNKYNIRGVLFALGKPANVNRVEINNNKEMMTTNDIKKIKRMGWEIGFHTDTHEDLTKLGLNDLKKEITTAKKNFEKVFGAVRYIAYPKGLYNNSVISEVKSAGFKAAFSTDGGSVSETKGDRIYSVSRICVEGAISMNQFKAMVSEPGIKFSRMYMNALKVKSSFAF